jgi:hypothetical protein
MASNESRVLTILFADVVGSTELLSRLGPDEGPRAQGVVLEAMTTAVAANGGAVVKELGDGVMASFESVRSAAAAAVAIQQTSTTVPVRVGLAIGEVTAREDDWVGLPAVVSARLCAAAPAESIYISDMALVLAGGDLPARPVGPLELKGIVEAVPTSELLWEAAPVDGAIPLPAALAVEGRLPFVGRTEELADLSSRWKAAVSGNGGLVLVAGEPGVGKTQLVAQLAREVHQEGSTVLLGRCDDELGIPYQPFVEAIRPLVGPGQPVEGALARVLGASAEDTAPVSADLARLQLFEAVHQALSDAAELAPVLLVLDDLHWASGPELALLRHLCEGLARLPLLVLGTYRDTDVDRVHPLRGLLDDLRRGGELVRLALDPLALEDVHAVLTAAAGHDLDDAAEEFAIALHAETDGNAFFLGEVLAHLVETGALVEEDGRWQGTTTLEEIGLPEGVRDVVGRRLSRLSDATNAVLREAAVFGRVFDLDLLEAIHDGNRGEVLDAVDAASGLRLIVEEGQVGGFSFSHALVRQSLLEELSGVRRARVHERIAQALVHRAEADERLLPVVAGHLLDAVPLVDIDEALARATEAHEVLSNTGATEDVIALVDRIVEASEALDHPPTGAVAAALAGRAFAQYMLGDRDAARDSAMEAVQVADAADDGERYAQAVAIGCSVAPWGMSEFTGLVPEAIRRAPPESLWHTRLHAHILFTRTYLDDGTPLGPAAERVLAASETSGDSVFMGNALGMVALADLCGPRLDRVEELSRRADDVSGVPGTGSLARGWGALRRGALEDASEAADEMVTYGSERKQTLVEAAGEQVRANVALLRGDFYQARRHIDLIGVIAPNDLMFTAGRASQRMWLALLEGDVDAAHDLWLTQQTRLPYPMLLTGTEALIEHRRGNVGAARAAAERLWEGGIDGVPEDWTRAGTLFLMAEAAANLDRADWAEAVNAELEPWDGQLILHVCTYVPASVGFERGRLSHTIGRTDEAVQRLETALAFEEACGAETLAARTRAELTSVSRK